MRRIWLALNHAGMALFVFVTLTGLFLWRTGSLHVGAAKAALPPGHSLDDGHGHGAHAGHGDAEEEPHAETGHDHGAEWCAEHDVPEAACTQCDPTLVAAFKAKGDWCGEHSLPESQCEACNPGCRKALKQPRAGQETELAELAKRKCEHDLPILDCDDCRFEVGVVKVRPSVAKALLATATVEPRPVARTLRLTGEVQLDKTRVVDVPPAASGRVTTVAVFLGQTVGLGDEMAVLHSGDFGEAKAAYLDAHAAHEIAREEQGRQGAVTAALKRLLERLAKDDGQAVAAVQATAPAELIGEWKSKLLGAAARLRLARSVHKREKDHWGKRVSRKADLENAEHGLQTARAEYASLVEEVRLSLSLNKLRADGAVRKAEAALNAAEQRLHIFGLDAAAVEAIRSKSENGGFARLLVKAPRAGTVIAQNVSQGKFVETSQSLYTVADLSNLWVWCDVYERDFAVLHARMAEQKTLKATVRVASFPDTAFPGTIDLVGGTLDEHTRTVKVRVQVANPHGKLKPGMFATVEVRLPSGRTAAMVPRDAVLSDEGQAFVFQKWTEDFWVRRDVTVGAPQGDLIEIQRGVPEGVVVASGGAFMLKSDVLRNKMGAG